MTDHIDDIDGAATLKAQEAAGRRRGPYSAHLSLDELLRRTETFEEWLERTKEPVDGWERGLRRVK